MAFNKNSTGFKIGQSIIGKSDQPFPEAPSTAKNNPKVGDIRSIDVKPVENGGWTVTHEAKPTNKGKDEPYDYDSHRKTHAFGDAKSAHAHLATLMGCDGK